MFTGIVTDTSPILSSQTVKDGLLMTIRKPKGWASLKSGDSIATNGVCLTAAAVRGEEYDCYLMPETLAKTSFGQQLPKSVNLERPLSSQGRFDGHFVQGHIDQVGKVVSVTDSKDGHCITIEFGKSNEGLVVAQGSVTVDGVSLTVADVTNNRLKVCIIPYTCANTTLAKLARGGLVNLEFDILGKYVVKNITLYGGLR